MQRLSPSPTLYRGRLYVINACCRVIARLMLCAVIARAVRLVAISRSLCHPECNEGSPRWLHTINAGCRLSSSRRFFTSFRMTTQGNLSQCVMLSEGAVRGGVGKLGNLGNLGKLGKLGRLERAVLNLLNLLIPLVLHLHLAQ